MRGAALPVHFNGLYLYYGWLKMVPNDWYLNVVERDVPVKLSSFKESPEFGLCDSVKVSLTSVSHRAGLSSSVLLHYTEKALEREKRGGLGVGSSAQKTLKMLSLWITASQGILFAWCDTGSGGNSGSGDQVGRRHTNTHCLRREICFFPLSVISGKYFTLLLEKSLGQRRCWAAVKGHSGCHCAEFFLVSVHLQ